MRLDSSFDFGLTGFAGRFHQDWRYEGTAAEMLAHLLGPQTDPREVEALRSDAASMRSGLTADGIETLWVAGTGDTFGFGPDGAWPSGPEWLDFIVDACERWLRVHGAPQPQPEPGGDSADTVAAEIAATTAALPERRDPGRAVTAALSRCVRACSPDLALRWTLRIARERSWPLDRSQYERLVRLGERFEYGEFVVADLEYLVIDEREE
ncbi:hypothetical protein [Micromonospora sp. URMC 103]|uniref:hypothetical protein n=1 Tax=Micromonospora sp. URMC 103 TaxID=3423406 RepID=UPI003F1CC202